MVMLMKSIKTPTICEHIELERGQDIMVTVSEYECVKCGKKFKVEVGL